MPRRTHHDALATADRPRWLVVKDMHGAVLDSTVIPTGTDLRDLMAAAIRERQSDGWTVEDDGAYGFLFCHKAGVRRMVAIRAGRSGGAGGGRVSGEPVDWRTSDRMNH